MKKEKEILVCLLFLMIAILPVGTLITTCFGYKFELASTSVFAITIAVISVFTVVLNRKSDLTVNNNVVGVLSAFITPLSLINAVLFMFENHRIWIIVSIIVSAVCCCFLNVRYGKPFALKTISLVLSAIMVLPVGFVSFIFLIFGNLGENTVMQTVVSPNDKYYAEVIDSDQGALGGDTLVDVYDKSGIDAILFRINKKPQRVYQGEWGEFEDMQIYWKNDNCLVINSVEYEIET